MDTFWVGHIWTVEWWMWGMIALAIVLVFNYFGVRLAIRVMLTFALLSFIPMVILAVVIIGKGGKDGNTLATMFNPGETSLFGITGGGVLGGILLGILLFVGFEAAASSARSPRIHIVRSRARSSARWPSPRASSS